MDKKKKKPTIIELYKKCDKSMATNFFRLGVVAFAVIYIYYVLTTNPFYIL